jgi:primosomal protein N' (replication factor Y)
VESLLDPEPALTAAQLDLAQWLASAYASPLIDCLFAMLPPGLGQTADSVYALVEGAPEAEHPIERRIVRVLAARGPLRGRQIDRALPRLRWRPAAERMVRRGSLARSSVLAEPSVRPKTTQALSLAVSPEEAKARIASHRWRGAAAERRRHLLDTLAAQIAPLDLAWARAEAGATPADVDALTRLGVVRRVGTEVVRDPLADLDYVPGDPPQLTSDQQAAWEPIRCALGRDTTSPGAFLLHGVTCSGKTEIYLRAVGEALGRGRTAIVIVPEISLTPQTVRRFLERFPGRVGLLHSRLSPGERYDTWRRVRAGALPVVVGARGALFAPAADLGLIVVDEEHDESLKEQGSPPRYHAREAALAYARMVRGVCVLGSATPDLGTFARCERGEIVRLSLPQRILGHRRRIAGQEARFQVRSRYRRLADEVEAVDLPPVDVVDMRLELRAGNRSLFSRALQHSLAEVLAAREQAILFLNRRGAATYVFCRDCGWTARCPRCDTPLTFHAAGERLQCHRCGYRRGMPPRCPNCGGTRVRQFGAGTQRVEAELRALLPSVQTLRWDRDTTRRAGAHAVLLAHFAAHRADVLIGTQMIAKGLDLPLVTLVGVISADTGLNLPDFRAAERTFQILTQVAGRAGRGLLGGRVIVQTYQPGHYAIQAASHHDYAAFYRQEMTFRLELRYPPAVRLARLVYQHPGADAAEKETRRVGRLIEAAARRRGGRADLIGPVPCFHRRVAGLFRWQVVIRAADPRPLIPEELPSGWVVDIDPVTLL